MVWQKHRPIIANCRLDVWILSLYFTLSSIEINAEIREVCPKSGPEMQVYCQWCANRPSNEWPIPMLTVLCIYSQYWRNKYLNGTITQQMSRNRFQMTGESRVRPLSDIKLSFVAITETTSDKFSHVWELLEERRQTTTQCTSGDSNCVQLIVCLKLTSLLVPIDCYEKSKWKQCSLASRRSHCRSDSGPKAPCSCSIQHD